MKGIALALAAVTAVTLLACSEAENDVKPLINDLPISMNLCTVLVLEAGEGRLYAGTDNGIFISQDDGHTWHTTSFKEVCTAITVDGNTVYAGTWSKGAFRSDDAGVTWKPIRDGLPLIDLDDGERYYHAVKQILVRRDKIIGAVKSITDGMFISTDRGETWHEEDWFREGIRRMTEFDNYLWISTLWNDLVRMPDDEETWEGVYMDESAIDYSDQIATDWAVLNNRLYVAMACGIARWNEKTQTWEYLMDALPVHRTGGIFGSYPRDSPWISSSAVHGDLLFVGIGANSLGEGGVYVFDTKTETWSSAGLKRVSINDLLSYKSSLYAGTYDGIYRAEDGRAVTTWERMTVIQGASAKD